VGCVTANCVGCATVNYVGCAAVNYVGCAAVNCVGCVTVNCVGCATASCFLSYRCTVGVLLSTVMAAGRGDSQTLKFITDQKSPDLRKTNNQLLLPTKENSYDLDSAEASVSNTV
jgi:hypothetical protein